MFRDECEIEVRGGKGGDGMLSFRREKYVPRGGPDGGDGGDGGSIVLYTTDRVNSLLDVGRRKHYKADKGRPGSTRNCAGARGEDLRIEVPVGTEVRDLERGHVLRDLTEMGDEVVIAAGGRGGRGNSQFANSIVQAPRHHEIGRDGEIREIKLVLKIVAEVGLIGLPNAGKSTFLSRVSAARPKIADYPFTTLEPQVGIAEVGNYDTLCIADLPGLIEGAAEGVGLGHQFLRHVERCQVLLHLVDVSEAANEGRGGQGPDEAWRVIEAELANYSVDLSGRPRITVATKCEDPGAEEGIRVLEAAVGQKVLQISSLRGDGLDQLLLDARVLVREAQADAAE
ncbi:MAG: GTPase ObgE [Planctomycetota bacterium]|nr:GTPase ObgE [Planctomycetota bacterium]MDG2141961.1 GTPase ObgE [Planctomycetota bacterium]